MWWTLGCFCVRTDCGNRAGIARLEGSPSSRRRSCRRGCVSGMCLAAISHSRVCWPGGAEVPAITHGGPKVLFGESRTKLSRDGLVNRFWFGSCLRAWGLGWWPWLQLYMVHVFFHRVVLACVGVLPLQTLGSITMCGPVQGDSWSTGLRNCACDVCMSVTKM